MMVAHMTDERLAEIQSEAKRTMFVSPRAVADLIFEVTRLRADAERLDALDNFCRRIAIRNLPYGDESGRSVFRWQVDASGELSRRPSIREAIDAARSPLAPTPEPT
jgi:hypothetical protein